jgi:hypothetical protein
MMNSKREKNAKRSLSTSGHKGMKVVLLAVLFLHVACGCSRPTKPKSDFITLKLGELTFVRYFDLLEKVTWEDDEVIRLADLIDSTMTDFPRIYAYRVIGSDGFYAAKKGSPDNIWEHMQKGYLKLSDRSVAFDPSLGLTRRYHISDVENIELLRKIDTKFKEEEESSFSLIVDMEVTTYLDSAEAFYNGRAGIKLSELIDTLTSTPEEYSYNLVSAGGEEKEFSWSEFQTGWWLLDLDLTRFSPDLGTDSRIPHLQTIELIPTPE